MAEKQLTEKELNELKEGRRAIALKNLKAGKLLNLAVAYNTQADKNYGEHDNSAVDEFLYRPALRNNNVYDLESGEESDLISNLLLSSREDGRRYSEQISGYGIIKTGTAIVQESLLAVRVEDLMDLVDSDLSGLKIKKAYQNRYVSDLLGSKNEEEKKVAQALISGYMQHLATQGVTEALNARAGKIRGGLEKIVSEEEKK